MAYSLLLVTSVLSYTLKGILFGLVLAGSQVCPMLFYSVKMLAYCICSIIDLNKLCHVTDKTELC